MFTITPIGNPNSDGRGNAIRIGHTDTDAVTIALDEYGPHGPGVTLALLRDAGRCEIFETDDGSAIRLFGHEYDVTIVLPFGLSSLRSELDMATDDRVQDGIDEDEAVDESVAELRAWVESNATAAAIFREDYEPSPYDGTYSED